MPESDRENRKFHLRNHEDAVILSNMDSIFFEKTGRAYSTCRNCEHYAACGIDGVDGYACKYSGHSSEYMPFSSVSMDVQSLALEIRHFMEDPMPDECPYYVQNSLAMFDDAGDPGKMAEEEFRDYSRIVEGKCSDVDFSGSLFDRMRSLDHEFDDWVESHHDCGCFYVREDDGSISAFAAFSVEDGGIDYSWVVPNGGRPLFRKENTRLAIMNFAFDYERRPFAGIGIMKRLFLKASELKVNEMYAASFIDEHVDHVLTSASMEQRWYAITSENEDDAAKRVWARGIKA